MRLSDALRETRLLYLVEMLVALQFQTSVTKEGLALKILALFQESAFFFAIAWKGCKRLI